MNYAKSINEINLNNNIKKTSEKKYFKNNTELLKNGYTIIRRNKETHKIEILENNKTKETKEKINKKIYNRKLRNMINNWNNYRDNDIEARGDMSIYYNYKEEIEKIINEDNEIEYILNERFNDAYNDYSSDEENNKFLLY
tara:strand:- start:13 stop:435 length:423 start_codon:yes stop_codon:yes gene_type:complete